MIITKELILSYYVSKKGDAMSKEIAATTPSRFDVVKGLFAKSETTIMELLPEGADLKRLVGGILMHLRINPGLLECTKESILFCGLKAFTLGLETTPELHQVALVPFNRTIKVGGQFKKIKEAQLMIEYRGFISLALQSNELISIDAYIVYENEVKERIFTLEYGLSPNITHNPNILTPPSKMGEKIGAYAVASFKDGSKKFIFMHLEDIYKRRDSSNAYQYDVKFKKKDTPWLAWEDEMIMKTVIKGLARTLQLSPTKSKFNQAVGLDSLAMGGKSQIPHFAKEIELLDLDVPGTFNEAEPNPEEMATMKDSDFGKATEGEGDPLEKPSQEPPKEKKKDDEQKPEKPKEKKERATGSKKQKEVGKGAENAETTKGSDKESPSTIRARVIDWMQNNSSLHDELKKKLLIAFPDYKKIGRYFNPTFLPVEDWISKNEIEIIDKTIRESGLYQ